MSHDEIEDGCLMPNEPLDFTVDVSQFTVHMLRKLEKHRDWGRSWKDATFEQLWRFLQNESHELQRAIFLDANDDQIIEEAADVANLCMMIADLARARKHAKQR